MSDKELIARLRGVCTCNIDSTPCMAEDDCRDAFSAADRIEELHNEWRMNADGWSSALVRIEELEAKLAKAEVINGLLTVVAILNNPNDGRFPEAVDLAERFSATIAELKGESHE